MKKNSLKIWTKKSHDSIIFFSLWFYVFLYWTFITVSYHGGCDELMMNEQNYIFLNIIKNHDSFYSESCLNNPRQSSVSNTLIGLYWFYLSLLFYFCNNLLSLSNVHYFNKSWFNSSCLWLIVLRLLTKKSIEMYQLQRQIKNAVKNDFGLKSSNFFSGDVTKSTWSQC